MFAGQADVNLPIDSATYMRLFWPDAQCCCVATVCETAEVALLTGWMVVRAWLGLYATLRCLARLAFQVPLHCTPVAQLPPPPFRPQRGKQVAGWLLSCSMFGCPASSVLRLRRPGLCAVDALLWQRSILHAGVACKGRPALGLG